MRVRVNTDFVNYYGLSSLIHVRRMEIDYESRDEVFELSKEKDMHQLVDEVRKMLQGMTSQFILNIIFKPDSFAA